jgi:hypothetical protein
MHSEDMVTVRHHKKINAIFTKEADIDAGVNFAISVRLIEDWLDILRKSGKIG